MKLKTLACLTLAALGLALASPLHSQTATGFDLQDGDTLVFLGDSITHQCLYTQYVEDFFVTRYPDRRIRFHNAGVSGDKAGDALARMEDDVLAYMPKYATILLGMNDGQYEDFSTEIFGTYRDGMTEILTQLQDNGITPVILSPTIFDHHQLALRMKDETFRFADRSFSDSYNSTLAFYSAWLRETAGQRKIPYVNLWGPLADFTTAERRTQPDFSLVEDAIHPGAAGQFVMAASLLQQFTPDRKSVSNVSVSKKGANWIARGGGVEIEKPFLDEETGHLTFTVTERSLPWVVTEEHSQYELKWGKSAPPSVGEQLTRAGHRLSNQRLQVSGLEPGKYELLIDDQPVGTYTHLQLGAKVELQGNEKTPQYQQALRVALLNRDRNDNIVRPLRDTWAKIKGARRNSKDPKATEAEIAELKEKAAELSRAADEALTAIYEEAQPVPRKYAVRLVE